MYSPGQCKGVVQQTSSVHWGQPLCVGEWDRESIKPQTSGTGYRRYMLAKGGGKGAH